MVEDYVGVLEAQGMRVTSKRKHKGYTIVAVNQQTGRKTYDVLNPDGSVDSQFHESLAVAKAEVDAALDNWD